MKSSLDSPERWVEEHGNALYRYALVRVRDEHISEELVQETFLSALQARERFTGGSSARTWLIGILKHKILDQFRRDARMVAMDDDENSGYEDNSLVESSFSSTGRWSATLSDWGDPEQAMENGQFWAVLQYCLDNLPKRLARLFVLREIMEGGTEEICKELAITPTNLWTMLYRARLGLRQCLEQNGVGTA